METNRFKPLSKKLLRYALTFSLFFALLSFLEPGLTYGEKNQKDIDILREEVKEIREGFNKNSKIFYEKINEIKKQIKDIEDALSDTKNRNEETINSINGEMDRIRKDLELIGRALIQNRQEDKADLKQSLETLKGEVREEIGTTTSELSMHVNQSLDGLRKDLEKNREYTDSKLTSMQSELAKVREDFNLFRESAQKNIDTLSQNLSALNENTRRHFEERDKKIQTALDTLKENLNEKDKKFASIIAKIEQQAEERRREVALLESTILKSIGESNKETLTTLSGIAKDLEDKAARIASLERRLDELDNSLKGLKRRFTSLEDAGGYVSSSVFSVFFESGSVSPVEEEPLRSVVRLLENNKTLMVRISGWGDIQGDPASSIEVAERRAMTVHNYLVSKGVDKGRISSIQVGRDMNPDVKQARRVDIFIYKPYTGLEKEAFESTGKTEVKAAPSSIAKPTEMPVEATLPQDVLYSRAKDLLDRKEYPEALEGFNGFLKLYPDGNLSDNAQYWIGEIYYAYGDYKRALAEFQKVIDRYPNGDKASSALLKQALTFYALGDKAKAKSLLEEVKKKYGGTELSVLAGQKLKELFGI